ncbi:hypothetical protein FF38_04444 [Lucilia cuprina]|uniref:Chitin-binding type-4 domain-containing protein n=1 Tax=Lucilia cuprina TaxID=7375 RepID=A0A0L0C6L3_LUCCU|nr:hypothetical protein CVS40_12905 [Lucilia cuprina]KNC28058.1 hypothetical protein FF38_04444 [Lucilia cuprina]
MNEFFNTKFAINKAQSINKSFLILLIFAIALNVQYCDGHGRLIEPPSRASAWRYGFNTPPDYNDHELYCGGFTRQWKRNEGKCGVCGDAWDMPEPRPHEHGGQWGQGVIVRRYAPGSEMTIRVELTASHMGYFEFRLCPEPKANQECLDRNLLTVLGGSPSQPSPSDLETRFYPRNGSRIYEIKAVLPEITCDQCVLQWRYIAGNNWGMCPDGNGAVGCGPQEEFRSCADIALGEGIPKRPVRPPIRPTLRPKITTSSTERSQPEESTEPFNYVPLLVIFILLFLGLILLAIWYLYRKNNPLIARCKEYLDKRLCKKKPLPGTVTVCSQKRSTLSAFSSVPALGNNSLKAVNDNKSNRDEVPVPPPRLKRNSRVKEMSPDESSVA